MEHLATLLVALRSTALFFSRTSTLAYLTSAVSIFGGISKTLSLIHSTGEVDRLMDLLSWFHHFHSNLEQILLESCRQMITICSVTRPSTLLAPFFIALLKLSHALLML